MKNCLYYYYNLQVEVIHHIGSQYNFEIDEYEYTFFLYEESASYADEIYKLSLDLMGKGIYCHQIILNKDSNVMTNYNNSFYILIRSYSNLNRTINLNDLMYLNNLKIVNDKLNHSNWKLLWENKIDYLEYQISNFGLKHGLLRNSFNYFSGFVETAIQLLNEIDFTNAESYLVLSHKRIKKDYTLFDLYNPFNFIIDFRVRDFCEYLKDSIFKISEKKIPPKLEKLEQIAIQFIQGLDTYEIQLFFIRLLYPSFYFDIFEDLIVSEEEDLENDQLKKIIDMIPNYEQFVIDIYNYCFKNNILPFIEWLKI